ncbi:MAG: 1-acyl-sn-glycerol-3-phosphate acyltransferase, partial [Planctomycetota bacterium]
SHRSFLDPVVIGCALRRRIHYFARSSLWEIAPIRWTLELFGGIPVDREKPQASTISHTISVLRDGRCLLMFPEGTRTRDGRLGRFRDGPALVARRAQVPVVPVYLVDTEGAWPRGARLPVPGRGKVQVIFGPAMYSNPLLPARQQDDDLSQRIAAWLSQTERLILGPEKT